MDGNWRDEVLRLTEDRDRLIEEVKAAMRERDIFRGEVESLRRAHGQIALDLKIARQFAAELRNLYAAEIDEGAKAFPLPWEVNDDTGRNGRRE